MFVPHLSLSDWSSASGRSSKSLIHLEELRETVIYMLPPPGHDGSYLDMSGSSIGGLVGCEIFFPTYCVMRYHRRIA